MTTKEELEFNKLFNIFWNDGDNNYDVNYTIAIDLVKSFMIARSNLKKKKTTKENKFDFFKAKAGESTEWLNPTTKKWQDVTCIISPNAVEFNGIIRITSNNSQWFDVESRTLRMKLK